MHLWFHVHACIKLYIRKLTAFEYKQLETAQLQKYVRIRNCQGVESGEAKM